MDGQDPWALAIELACVAGRNWEEARRLDDHPGLIKVAAKASRGARELLTDGLAELMLGERRGQGGGAPAALNAGGAGAGEAEF